MAKSIRIATYNIHRCFGTDKQFNPQRILSVLAQLGAQVIAIQELETVADSGLTILEQFAQHLGYTPIAGPTVLSENTAYGNALLINGMPARYSAHNISIPDREPRGVINCQAVIKEVDVDIFATHFGLSRWERLQQSHELRRLMARSVGAVNARAAKERPKITIAMGDFNFWHPWCSGIKQLDTLSEPLSSPGTFPSFFPYLRLDRFWVAGEISAYRTFRWDTHQARLASDHLPLIADIHLD